MLGRFHGNPAEQPDPRATEIIYIGETCNQTFETRWYQFHRSAFLQKPGHSGGWTFAAQFCNNELVEPFDWLYVAAYPVDMGEPHRSCHIRFVERWLIWMHVETHNRLPCCNTK